MVGSFFIEHQKYLKMDLINKSCSCGCLHSIDRKEIENNRQIVYRLSETQKTNLIVGLLRDQASTLRPHHYIYRFHENQVCLDAFCFIYDISHHKMETIHSHLNDLGGEDFERLLHESKGTLVETSSSKRVAEKHGHLPKLAAIQGWLVNWVHENRTFVDETHASCLVDNFNWAEVYTSMTESWDTSLYGDVPSLRYFYIAKESVFNTENIKIFRPQDHPVCQVCVELGLKLKQTPHDKVIPIHSQFIPFNSN